MRKHPRGTLAAILLSGCITNSSLLSGAAIDGCSTNTPSTARHMSSPCQFTKETWDFLLQLENWIASFEVSVSNPMTYTAGNLNL